MRIVIVGGGMQGRVITENLLARPEKPEVTVVDVRQPTDLPKGAKFLQADILDPKQALELAKGADAAVLAVPSEIAHKALSNLLKAGVPVADVCFTPDPPLDLDKLAKESGACCVVDVGVAPGLSHILVGAAHAEFGGLDSAKIMVGGMPKDPPPVFKHAIYFNPSDLLSEYIRPARARTAGKNIEPAPLDHPIETHIDVELGPLEMFLSDGLRSLLGSFPDVPEMAELTLRWPGHLDAMKDMRELGLFESQDTVHAVAKALNTKYPTEKFPDVLVMIVECSKGQKRRAWRLIDRRTNNQSAMSRTTGFTTAAVAMLLAKKMFNEPGVHVPEVLGRDPKLVKAVVDDLAERGVVVSNLVPVTA